VFTGMILFNVAVMNLGLSNVSLVSGSTATDENGIGLDTRVERRAVVASGLFAISVSCVSLVIALVIRVAYHRGPWRF
jgi:hypothetical protein